MYESKKLNRTVSASILAALPEKQLMVLYGELGWAVADAKAQRIEVEEQIKRTGTSHAWPLLASAVEKESDLTELFREVKARLGWDAPQHQWDAQRDPQLHPPLMEEPKDTLIHNWLPDLAWFFQQVARDELPLETYQRLLRMAELRRSIEVARLYNTSTP
ncbi:MULTISPECIES: hypothetical protein [Aphanothece]|uniref:hypothetical protein n=1 Tax=Aphanothece TaxID=1121 RepID=UPI00398EDAF0